MTSHSKNGAESLREAYEAGRLSRTELWTQIKALTASLQSLAPLLEGTVITQVAVSTAGLQVVLDNELVFALDPNDIRQAANIILAQGEYEKHEHAVLAGLWMHAGVFFDIGANAGWYALHAALENPACKIYGFEPVPDTYDQLVGNIGLNDLCSRIEALKFGLSDAPGEQTMYRPAFSGSPAASMRDLHPDEGSETFTCRFRTLDEYFPQSGAATLDLIKCDVEGAELFVLRGGLDTIAAHKPYIFIEILRKWSRAFGYEPSEIFDLLAGLDYEAWAVGGSGIEPISEMTEDTVETNFIFRHKARPPLSELLGGRP